MISEGRGDRDIAVSVSVSFPISVLWDLDQMRGDVARSRFLTNLVREKIKEVAK